MTNVLMTTDTVGGVWTYSLELADALAPHGVRVTLATMGPPMTVQQRREVAGSAVLEVHESTFPLEWMDSPWTGVDAAGSWLLDLECRTGADLVHLNGYVHAPLPWRSPTVVVAHSCVLSWWRAVHGIDAPHEWDEYRERVRAGLRAAGTVLAPTQAMLDELRACYGIERGTVVANCRQPARFGNGPKEPLVLAAGRRWDEAKNIEAVERVGASLPWRTVVAGDGLRTSSPVEVLGRQSADEMVEWLRRASIYVAPARYEPFGLGVLEAALSGCALVLGDIPSLREVWGSAACYVDPDDDRALRDACRSLIDDDHLRTDLARRAVERARRYAPERTARAYLDACAGAEALVGAAP